MSQDTYQLDRYKHGAIHVDRYNKQGYKVGRYTLKGVPIVHMRIIPPPILRSDREKFDQVIRNAK